jgi:outer membrane protein
MKRNKKYIQTGKIIAIALLISNAAMAQVVNQFSAKQAVDYGMKNSVQVKNALLDVLIQKQTNRLATSAALPQINGSAGTTHYFDIPVQPIPDFITPQIYGALIQEGVYIKDPNTGTYRPANSSDQPKVGILPFSFYSPWNANIGVTLTQVIFDGQVFVGLKARKVVMEAAHRQEEITEQNIKENIYKIYYQLIASKTQIALLDSNIVRLQKLDHDTKEIYKNGFAEKLDVDRLAVQITNLQTEELQTKDNIANGYSGLKVLMGMPFKDSLVLTDTLNDDKIREGVLENSNYKYSDRKEYLALELATKLHAMDVTGYQRSLLPTLSLNAGYSKQAQDSAFNFLQSSEMWYTSSYIGLQLNVPIFRGFSTRAKIEKAKLETQQSKNQLDNLKISIDNDVAVAKNNLATAITTMDAQKQNMQLAETVYDQTKKKYEVGTGSLTDINNSETDLQSAETNYISALYNAIIAKVDFLKAVGKL